MTVPPLLGGGRLTDDQEAFVAMVQALVAARVEPDAREADREERLPVDLVRLLVDAELLSVGLPVAGGGGGADALTTLLLVEVLSRSSAAAAVPVVVTHACGAALATAGDDERMATVVGGVRVAVADGPDVRAQRRDGTYELHGAVGRVDELARSEACLLVARAEGDEPVVVWLSTSEPGFDVSPPHRRTGLRGAPTHAARLTGCVVGDHAVVGGPAAAVAARHWLLLGTAAQALGVAGRALADVGAYLPERRQFGTTLDRMPVLREMVGRAAARVQAAAAQVTTAASPEALLPEGAAACHAAAWAAVTAAVAATVDAVQLHGGYGCVTETAVERCLRDALSLRAKVGVPSAELRVADGWFPC